MKDLHQCCRIDNGSRPCCGGGDSASAAKKSKLSAVHPSRGTTAERNSLTGRVELQGKVAHGYPNGLTRREVEVLRLIAAGRTDREIAEELVISFRTVGNHVRSILNRTSTANRTEAATYAARNDLL